MIFKSILFYPLLAAEQNRQPILTMLLTGISAFMKVGVFILLLVVSKYQKEKTKGADFPEQTLVKAEKMSRHIYAGPVVKEQTEASITESISL